MQTITSPPIKVLRSDQRGHQNHGWLNALHSFSFGQYHNPQQMGFRSLRVINQDTIQANTGFPTHPHRDMEIFTYMLDGALEHRDSMGNHGVIEPGQIQVMSAGSGITHSEWNHSPTTPAQLLQIWITPSSTGLTPRYTDWTPSKEQAESSKSLIISQDGREQSATIHQDASIYKIKLRTGESVTHELMQGRGAWLQLIRGQLNLNEQTLHAGDAGFTEQSGHLNLSATEDSEALLFDLK